MEERLAAYRLKKERENSAKQSIFKRIFNLSSNKDNLPSKECRKQETSKEEVQAHHACEAQPCVEVPEEGQWLHSDWRQNIPLALKVLLWFLLWKFFIEIGFGAVYFILSSSYLMYRNTRTGPRQRNTLSAYSVFNPNQERIDGTFTTEQFEKELRFGAGSVKQS